MLRPTREGQYEDPCSARWGPPTLEFPAGELSCGHGIFKFLTTFFINNLPEASRSYLRTPGLHLE